MSKPPLIRAVKAMPPATLEIAWRAGEKLTVDVSRLIKRFKLYAPLRNAALFGRAKADPWGHAVNWPGDIDMGADQLYELAREEAGKWGPEQFAAWMAGHGLSLSAAADALGLSRRMIAHYRTGSRPIPRVVALACEGLSMRWKKRVALAPEMKPVAKPVTTREPIIAGYAVFEALRLMLHPQRGP